MSNAQTMRIGLVGVYSMTDIRAGDDVEPSTIAFESATAFLDFDVVVIDVTSATAQLARRPLR
jgi:hypothetical protein